QILLQAAPHDGELHHLLARCLEASGRYAEADDAYRQAVRWAPGRVECYAEYAQLLHSRRQSPKRADQVMNELVQANPSSAEAWLARGRYLRVLAAREADSQARQAKLSQAALDINK